MGIPTTCQPAAGGLQLSVDQVAERIGLRPWTIRHWLWRAGNGLPLHSSGIELARLAHKVGNCVRFSAADVEAWFKRRRSELRGYSASRSLEATGNRAKLQADATALAERLERYGKTFPAKLVRLAVEALEQKR